MDILIVTIPPSVFPMNNGLLFGVGFTAKSLMHGHIDPNSPRDRNKVDVYTRALTKVRVKSFGCSYGYPSTSAWLSYMGAWESSSCGPVTERCCPLEHSDGPLCLSFSLRFEVWPNLDP